MSWVIIIIPLVLTYFFYQKRRKEIAQLIASMNAIFLIYHLCSTSFVELIVTLSNSRSALHVLSNLFPTYLLVLYFSYLIVPLLFVFRRVRTSLVFTIMLVLLVFICNEYVMLYLMTMFNGDDLPSTWAFDFGFTRLIFWLETMILLGFGILLYGTQLLPERRKFKAKRLDFK